MRSDCVRDVSPVIEVLQDEMFAVSSQTSHFASNSLEVDFALTRWDVPEDGDGIIGQVESIIGSLV